MIIKYHLSDLTHLINTFIRKQIILFLSPHCVGHKIQQGERHEPDGKIATDAGVYKWGRPTGNDLTARNWLTLFTEGKSNIKVWLVSSSFSFYSFELEFCYLKLSQGRRRHKWKTAKCKNVCLAKDKNNSYQLWVKHVSKVIKQLIDNNSDHAWDRESYCCVVLRCGRVVIVSPFRATRLVEREVRKIYLPRTWVFCGLFSVLHSQ